MGDDSGDPGAGAVADGPTGYRGECHGCRRDVATVDCTTEDPVHAIKYDEDIDGFALSSYREDKDETIPSL